MTERLIFRISVVCTRVHGATLAGDQASCARPKAGRRVDNHLRAREVGRMKVHRRIFLCVLVLAWPFSGVADDKGAPFPDESPIVLENDRIRAEIDPQRAVLTRLEIRRSTGRARGDVAINRSDHPGARWRLWCGVDGTRHTVLTTFNTAGGQGIDRRGDAVTINTRFGREPSQLLPVHLRVSYTLDERGIWMHAKLSSDVEVRLEQLEYILFFHFKGDAQRTKGRAFFAPGWSDEFTDLEPQRKKCPRNSSSKYFYSAPWLDRRAMGVLRAGNIV